MIKSSLSGVLGVSVLLVTSTVSSAQNCDYSGQSYTPGTTVCECPSISVTNLGSTGAKGTIVSRRLACRKDDGWVDTKATCVDISGNYVEQEFYKLTRLYCPKLTQNPSETEAFFEDAPKVQSVAAVKGICKRFGSMAALCKTFLDALQKD